MHTPPTLYPLPPHPLALLQVAVAFKGETHMYMRLYEESISAYASLEARTQRQEIESNKARDTQVDELKDKLYNKTKDWLEAGAEAKKFEVGV